MDNQNLQSRVDKLWDHVERHLSADPDLLKELHRIDCALRDGSLTEARLRHTEDAILSRLHTYASADSPALRAHRESREDALFGDYELIIDACLGGDEKVKEAVRKADNDGRHGLLTLKQHLTKSGAAVPAHIAAILRECEADQTYYTKIAKADAKGPCAGRTAAKHIDERNGKYRVRMGTRDRRISKTFDTLFGACRYRDAVLERWDLEDHTANQIKRSDALIDSNPRSIPLNDGRGPAVIPEDAKDHPAIIEYEREAAYRRRYINTMIEDHPQMSLSDILRGRPWAPLEVIPGDRSEADARPELERSATTL
jgi:hypothetical protein